MLYLTDKAFNLLASLDNASAFVSKLIESNLNLDLKEGLIHEKEDTSAKVEVMSKELEKIEGQIQKLEQTEKIEQTNGTAYGLLMEQKSKEKIVNLRQNFKDYINRDITNQELKDYVDKFDKGEINFWDYVEFLRQTDFQQDAKDNPD